MVSVLQTAMLHGGDVGKAMEWYPKISGEEEERANKYWVMYGNTGDIQSRRYGYLLTEVYVMCSKYKLCHSTNMIS